MANIYITDIAVVKPADLGPTPWRVQGLRAITIVFGKNGSGKSRFLRAWRDQNPDWTHYIVPERTGNIEYQPNLLQQQMEGSQRSGQGQRNFLNNYREQIVTRVQVYFAARGNVRVDQLPGDPADLEARLSTLLPDFAIALSGTKNPPYAVQRASDSTAVQNIDHLSSGEAQVLTVGLDILTVAAIWDIEGRKNRLMLIDEPDAHIHPDLQVRFADFLVGVAEKYKLQVAIATHSTTLLAAVGQFSGEEAGILYLDRVKEECHIEPFDKYKKEMAACLGGHALMGPLFGVPLLLVEGDDDYRIWSQVPRHHKVSFATIPANGDEIDQFQKNLEKLFEALRENAPGPAGYALLDGDKAVPTANVDRPQKHIKFVGLGCHEAENLYLTDEVLALTCGKTWTEASAAIKERAPEFGDKADRLSEVESWDRRTVDLKGFMVELMAILDPKNVHWTIRVARTIGEKRPTGQLAEFLGESLVTALWGSVPA
ncbi:MAG: AAA family ATPase [Deltaproteobacteria bacterium]|nr:AAA family ATPase [Deltaproteobacteria bacterium]